MAGIGGFKTFVVGESNLTAVTGIVEVTSISLPELGMTDIDVSSFDSASNYMEFVGGSIDPGVVDMELNYDAANDDLILLALGDVNETWTITFPDASTWATDGYVNKMGGGTTAPNDKISRTMSIKCSGVPTHVA
jgi:hypothetical protein